MYFYIKKKKNQLLGTIIKVSLLRTRTIIFSMKAKMQTHVIADAGVQGKHLRGKRTGNTLQPKSQHLIPHLNVTQSPAQPLDTHLCSALDSPVTLPNKRYVSPVYTVLRAHAHSSRGSGYSSFWRLLTEELLQAHLQQLASCI